MRQLLLLLALLIASPLLAQEYHVVQGDVLTLHREIPAGAVSLECFGKQWPVVREKDGKVWAWVGVDLRKATGNYPIVWHAGNWNDQDRLVVSKGEFRISRITVEKKMAVFGPDELKRIRTDQKLLKDSYRAKVDATPFIHITQMPTPGVVSTPFGAQRYVNGEARSPHSGIDIAAPEGTPVITPLSGKVLVVSDMYLNGKTVAIGHGHGLVSVFSHLHDVAIKKGEWIDGGSRIGSVGMSGRATGPHLHWGIRFNQARINPYSIMRLQNDRDG